MAEIPIIDMITPFLITHNDRDAWAVHVRTEPQVHTTLEFFGVLGMPAILVIGGAGGMTDDDLQRVDPVAAVILQSAQKKGAVIVDGGTDAGVMAALGRMQAELKLDVPLIGVAAAGTVFYPGKKAEMADAAPLEPHHTHFILVPGSAWGDESVWIDSIVSSISGKSVAVVINGGAIAKADYELGLVSRRPTILLAGSGRLADELATQATLPPHVHVVNINDLASLTQKLGKFL